MTILKVEQIFIFQQVCCYGNSCELLFVRTHGAKAPAQGSPGSPREGSTQQQLGPGGNRAGRGEQGGQR